MPTHTTATSAIIRLPIIYAAFLLSGFAALIYQIVWQRSLFALYGVNIESVTIVVSAFMLGLGLGSFAAGFVSKDLSRPLLLYFGIVEVCIAAYGVISLWLFHQVGLQTAGVSGIYVFLLTFCLVLFPTALMGATLPLLVAYAVSQTGNVGKSISGLYFINTLGSAIASFLTAIFILGTFGQQNAVLIAAVANVGTALLILIPWLRARKKTVASS